jgi:uncharacterized membrane protein HdeD (DUF308 family)
MSSASRSPVAGHGVLERTRSYSLPLGIGLIVLGVIALGATPFLTTASLVILGLILFAGGLMFAVWAFAVNTWAGFAARLLTALLFVLVGWSLMTHTLFWAAGLALFMAIFFPLVGLVMMVAAVIERSPNWIWQLVAGAIVALLGILVLNRWPVSANFAVGIGVALSLIAFGVSVVVGWWATRGESASTATA